MKEGTPLMNRAMLAVCLLPLSLLAGCPTTPTDPVQAVIAYSTRQGPAPLSISFSAVGSTSVNGGPLTYRWDFGDGTTSTEAAVAHVFENPGRYFVRLTVTDPTGEQGTATQEVRAAGTGANAVLRSDVTNGRAPLGVQFDGTGSNAPDDDILDYYWDFGDGGTSRLPDPYHVFENAGQFLVTLRVVTAGGVEDTAEVTITVGKRAAALQFNGSSFATLPLSASFPLGRYTFEAWVKADADGGTVATLGGGAMALEIAPSASIIRVRINGVTREAAASNLSGAWRHLAAVFNTAESGSTTETTGCTLYLDGQPLGSVETPVAVTANSVILGLGLRGKVAEVRLWSVARTAAEIAAAWNVRLSGLEQNLLGYWPLDEGSGQTLTNRTGGPAGILGATTQVETTDPAWSPEDPPL